MNTFGPQASPPSLGTLVKEEPLQGRAQIRSAQSSVLLMSVFALLALGFLVWVVILNGWQTSVDIDLLPYYLALVLLLVLASLVLARWFKTKRNRQRIRFYEQGIEWIRDNKTDRFRYEDLKTSLQAIKVTAEVVPLGSFRSRWLMLPSGSLLGIENDAIWYPLREKILAIQLPQAIMAYQHGDVVDFGGVRISSEGLAMEPAASIFGASQQIRLIPWTDVGEVFIERGNNRERLCIKKPRGLMTSAAVGTERIHNFHVLMGVLSHLGYLPETFTSASPI